MPKFKDGKKAVVKTITIREDQEEFLNASYGFKLSKFVQDKLDEFIEEQKKKSG